MCFRNRFNGFVVKSSMSATQKPETMERECAPKFHSQIEVYWFPRRDVEGKTGWEQALLPLTSFFHRSRL